MSDPSTSPGWKKPSEIMKMRKKRKSEIQLKSLAQRTRGEMLNQPYVAKQSLKRKNPFKCSSSPKRTHSDSVLDENSRGVTMVTDSELFGLLDQTCQKDAITTINKRTVQNEGILETVLKTQIPNVHIPANITSTPDTCTEKVPEEKPCSDILPVDWGIKQKARFTSDKPFTWCSPLKTTEEASGLSSFVRCSDSPLHENKTETSVSSYDEEKSELQRHCLLWYHPNLPWLKLFPRAVPDHQVGKTSSSLLEEDVCKALLANWVESLTSVFHMLRARHCPYFYLCCHQFTVLFRAAGIAGKTQIHAVLSPTTRGFREALKKEGIEFSMPLYHKKYQSESSSTQDQKQTSSPKSDTPTQESTHSHAADGRGDMKAEEESDEEEDLLEGSHEGASSWLESMGLDKSRFPSLNPHRVKLQREGYKVIDNRPESMVYVEGGDTQALYNYLLNCRSCIAASGVQAGIPPTIMAPSAFKGATLMPLKVKSGSVKLPTPDGSTRQGYSLEVWGPLLPHSVQGLCRLLKHTQQGQFNAVFRVDETSVVFNVPRQEAGFSCDADKLNQCGINPQNISQFTSDNELGKTGIREIVCTDGKYLWSS